MAVGISVAVPPVACVPVHPPLAVQLVALVDDHVSVALDPKVMLVGETASDTVGAAIAFTVKVAPEVALPPAPAQVSV